MKAPKVDPDRLCGSLHLTSTRYSVRCQIVKDHEGQHYAKTDDFEITWGDEQTAYDTNNACTSKKNVLNS